MQRPSRIRRIAKWTGVCLWALILAMWLFSFRYGANLSISRFVIFDIVQDYFRLGYNQSGAYFQSIWGSSSGETIRYYIWNANEAPTAARNFFGWPHFSVRNIKYVDFTCINIPYWLLLLAVMIPTLVLFYRDPRRIPVGHCTQCRYNLTGNTTGVCPECGTKIRNTNAV